MAIFSYESHFNSFSTSSSTILNNNNPRNICELFIAEYLTLAKKSNHTEQEINLNQKTLFQKTENVLFEKYGIKLNKIDRLKKTQAQTSSPKIKQEQLGRFDVKDSK